MKNDDVALIRKILNGDEIAFAKLVKKYQKAVHTLAWRKIGDFHIAEDITQDAFLKVYQRLHSLKDPSQFSGWIYVITTRLCATWLRKNRIQTQPLEDVEETMGQRDAYSQHVVEEHAKTAVEAQREVVKKLLAKLKESERTVMTLHYLGEMSVEDISKFLGVSAGTIKSRLQRARNRLQKEETMIREALEHFQISPTLTDNIMQEISQTKQVAPISGKPLIPWIVGVTAVTIVLLMLGFSNQFLSRFQKPYNFNAASDMKVELIDTPIVQNLESDPDDRTQFGNANAQGENNGSDQQDNNAAQVDLETIITKIKHYDNAITSVTGDFIMQRHRKYEISRNQTGDFNIDRDTDANLLEIESKIVDSLLAKMKESDGIDRYEYKLTFEGEKIRIDQKLDSRPIMFWDGKQHWEVSLPSNLIFTVEKVINKESTVSERIKQVLKQVGIENADHVHITPSEFPNSFKIIAEDRSFFILFEGETTVKVYDGNLNYAVRPYWALDSDWDPRWWFTFPSDGSSNFYLSQPLWQLLEEYESQIIGNEIVNGEKITVILLKKPSRTIRRNNTVPARNIKLWISHDIGFRLVKSEEEFIEVNPRGRISPLKAGVTYIRTRKIDYHEYLPNVWFPKRIEFSMIPKTLQKQQDEQEFIFKDVIITKQCQLNTDVSTLFHLDISPDTLVNDYSLSHTGAVAVKDLETQPNFQIQPRSTTIPKKNNDFNQQTFDSGVADLQQWNLPKGAKTRIGKGRIYDIAYSSDGTRLAVASSIGVWIYDADSGKELDLLTEHTDKVLSVAFNLNGNILASGSDDGSIHLWDTRTSTHLRTMTEDTSLITNVVFNGDGKMLASASKDNTIRLWNTQTGEIQKNLKGHADNIFSIWLSGDGKMLASASKDNTIRLWDTQSGEIQKNLDLEHSQEIYKMAFSADGKTLASWCFESPIYLWNAQTGELRHTLPLEQMDIVNEFAFSPDGKTLASAMHNGIVHLWNVQTGERLRSLIGHTHWALNVVFSPDSKTLASGSFDSTIRFWEVQTGKPQKTLTGHLSDTVHVAFSPDGKTLANAMEDDTIHLWDAQTGEVRQILKRQNMPSIEGVAFSPDSKTLASGSHDGLIHLWDVQTGKLRKTFSGHTDYVTSVAFSPDGTLLVSGSWDKTIQLYHAQTGELLKTFSGHTDWVMSVAFSPDKKMIASGSKDNTVRIWDVQTGEILKTLTGHAGVVFSVAFAPNGKTLASGSHDGLIHLWDVQTGKLLETTEHTDWVMSVAFSPDSRTLASGSKDSTIQLWDTQTNIVQQISVGHTD